MLPSVIGRFGGGVLYIDQQTGECWTWLKPTSALIAAARDPGCHKQTHAPQQTASLFDDAVSAGD